MRRPKISSFKPPAENPFDVQSAQISLNGFTPRWQSSAVVKFRNGSSADLKGLLSRGNSSWRFGWQTAVMAFPSAGSWAAQRPGSLTWQADLGIDIRELDLVNGDQSLRIAQAFFGKESRVSLTATQMDPGPWTKLFMPDLALTEGVLNASIQLSGKPDHFHADGFLNGKIKSLTSGPLGLTLHAIEIDVRSSDQGMEIKRFVGKTKKGDVTITGASHWPTLDYSLHAHELILQPNSSVKATGGAEIHLGGTLNAPMVTGRIGIEEGLYAMSKKEKPKKSTPAVMGPSSGFEDSALWRQTSLDVTTQWARNVWYRDGISSIETRGDLRVQKSKEKKDLLLTGTIDSVRGTYNEFGRDFTIESGEIRFAGTPDIDPALNIEASYRSDPTVVYLDITGSLSQPKLALRSNPPLSEQDIISVVVFRAAFK